MSKVFNFSAGPAMIFPEVLHKAQAELTNWLGQGVSVMEVSHRGKYFMELITQAEKDLREVYHIPDNYRVIPTRWRTWSICSLTDELNW
jgi:3-phosphoserine/phosphohydroxythreonine aminotransferase